MVNIIAVTQLKEMTFEIFGKIFWILYLWSSFAIFARKPVDTDDHNNHEDAHQDDVHQVHLVGG